MNAPCMKEGPLEKLAQGQGAHRRAWLKEPWPSGGPGVTQKRPSQAPSLRREPHPPGPAPSVCASFGASSSPAPTPLPSGQARNSAAELSFEHPDLPPAPQGPGGEWTPHLSEPLPCSGGSAQAARRLPVSRRGHWPQSKGGLGDRPAASVCLSPDGLPGRHTWSELSMGAWFAATGVDSGIFEIPEPGTPRCKQHQGHVGMRADLCCSAVGISAHAAGRSHTRQVQSSGAGSPAAAEALLGVKLAVGSGGEGSEPPPHSLRHRPPWSDHPPASEDRPRGAR